MHPNLHPALAPLAFLVGTWAGSGRGIYPTIDDFTYDEEIGFAHIGKPFLAYSQKTRRTGSHPDAGLPLHAEVGYVRPAGPHRAELVIAQPTGVLELHDGVVDGTTVAFTSTTVVTTPTAKVVSAVERRIDVRGDDLRYELLMTAVGQVHQLHLEATLHRRS